MAFKLKEGGLLDILTGGPRRRARRALSHTTGQKPVASERAHTITPAPEAPLTKAYVHDVVARARQGDLKAQRELGRLQGLANVGPEGGMDLRGWLYEEGQRASRTGRITL